MKSGFFGLMAYRFCLSQQLKLVAIEQKYVETYLSQEMKMFDFSQENDG